MCLTVLGIELDSLTLRARLSQEKFEHIAALLDTWSSKQLCTKKELESLIGHLWQHACTVIPPGWTFLPQMIYLLSTFWRDDHPIRLNSDFRFNLTWWREVFHSWDSFSFLLSSQWAPLVNFHISSVTAGTGGYGSIFNDQWFVGQWSSAQQPLSIAYKELFPMVVVAYLWGHVWVSERVEFRSHNMALVSVLCSGTSRDPNIMVLLCHLSLIAACQSFVFTTCQTAGRDNIIADLLSHFDFQRFRCLAPQAAPGATPVPPSLLAQLRWFDGKMPIYLANGLALSTWQVYASAQRQFLEFCNEDASFSQSQPPLPASCIHQGISAVYSLHITYGLSDPLLNCLQRQHLLRGIKCPEGSNLTQCQPVTPNITSVLHRPLDLANPDNIMLWAACCVGFFGFLRGGEFIVNSPFDPSLHLTLADIQVDTPLNPQSVRVFIKCSKTDPFQKGCFVFLGRDSAPLCGVVSLVNYLHLRRLGPGPLFLCQDGIPLSRSKLSVFLQCTLHQQVFLKICLVIALELEPLLLLPAEEFLASY